MPHVRLRSPSGFGQVETGILHVGSMPATLASHPFLTGVLCPLATGPFQMLFFLLGIPFPAPTPLPSIPLSLLCYFVAILQGSAFAGPPGWHSNRHPAICPGLQRALAILTNRFPQYPLQILPPQILTIQTQVLNTLRSRFLEMGLVSAIIPYYSLSQTQEQKRVDSPASLVIQSLCQTLESFRLGE